MTDFERLNQMYRQAHALIEFYDARMRELQLENQKLKEEIIILRPKKESDVVPKTEIPPSTE